jgi:hypothetical protein
MDTENSEIVNAERNDIWTKYLRIDNALLVAVTPLVVYVLITAYTVGKYRYFGVPYELLSVRFTDNLFTIILLSALVMFMGSMFGFGIISSPALFNRKLRDLLRKYGHDDVESQEILAKSKAGLNPQRQYFSGAMLVVMLIFFITLLSRK